MLARDFRQIFPIVPRRKQAAKVKAKVWPCTTHAILASKNEQASVTTDSVISADDVIHYPVKLLNALKSPGLATQILRVIVPASIILLRNKKPPNFCKCSRSSLLC